MAWVPLPWIVLSVTVFHLRLSSANTYVIGTPPSFTSNGEPPATYVVDVQQGGNNLVLPCEVSGTPPITVSWFREGILIRQIPVHEENNGTRSISVTESEANVTAPPEGTNYYCEVTNRIGHGNYNAILRSRNTTVSRYFFGGFRNTEVMDTPIRTAVDGQVLMECDFNPSNPDPEVTWFANGTIMLDKSGGRQILEEGRYLYISQLLPASRAMRYHCEVRNPLYENGMAIRAPTMYTVNTDLGNDEFITYKELGSRVGEVGENIQFIFAAAITDSSGISIALSLFCPGGQNPLVFFLDTATRPLLTVRLREEARNMTTVIVSCMWHAGDISRSVNATIIIPEPETPANITQPARDDPSLTDREHLVGDGPVEYSCVASGSPAPTITWYYNGVNMPPGTRNGVEVSSDHTQLTIEELEVRHSGIYQCMVKNQLADDSRTWILEVVAPEIGIGFISSSLNAELREIPYGLLLLAPSNATDLVITAMVNFTIVSGISICPSAQWKINGTVITTDTSDYEATDSCDSPNNISFTFNLTLRDQHATRTIGNYSVMFLLQSRVISTSQGLFITHSADPVILSISGVERRVRAKDSLELQCMYLDIFSTSVVWSKDGTNLTSTSRITITEVMSGVSVLRITSVTLEDAGVYSCTTGNEAGQDRQEAKLEILESNTCAIIGGFLGHVGALLIAFEVVVNFLS